MKRAIRFFGGLLIFAAAGGCTALRESPKDAASVHAAPVHAAPVHAAPAHAAPAHAAPDTTSPPILARDLGVHVAALTAPEMQGRLAGSAGERVAANYLRKVMAQLGLEPAGDDGGFLHAFDFTSGVALGPNNALSIGIRGTAARAEPVALEVGSEWRPLAFSRSDSFAQSEIVFAGYGIVAPASGDSQALNEYTQIDAQDRWVLVFRGMPSEIEGERRRHLQPHISLRHKAMVARDRGARGILFMSGPLGQFREELVPLRFDASLAGTRIGALTLTDAAVAKMISPQEDIESGATNLTASTLLAEIQTATNQRILATLDGRRVDREMLKIPPSALSSALSSARLTLQGRIDLETIRSTGHNVLGRLQTGPHPTAQTVVMGAHFDHLGFGETTGSLASGDQIGLIHPGADDNASGVAALLEVAENLRASRDAGSAIGKRDFIFAAWSGEELGLLGSDAWAREGVHPHSTQAGPIAYLNFDMVGRLRDELIVQGLGSSPSWPALLDSAMRGSSLRIVRQDDAYLPTDVTSFYTQGVPVLAAFTGVHSEYHTPADLPELLNLEGTAEIAALFTEIASAVSLSETPPPYQAQARPSASRTGSGFRVFLGTIPDYAQTDLVGVRLSGVAPGGPAEQAGLQSGDIIVEVADRAIENLYDYTYALQALRVGEAIRIVVERAKDRISFDVVPQSRD